MNNVSVLSDYEQHSASTLSERDILASVLHEADKFSSPLLHPSSTFAFGDPTASDPNSTTRPPNHQFATMKSIRTMSDIHSLLALSACDATADAVIVGELIEEILCAAMRSADNVIDVPFVSSIVRAATQSLPRCTGVYDLHLGSSKALLGHRDTISKTKIDEHQAECEAHHNNPIVQQQAESITSILVYDADQSIQTTEIDEPKMLSTRPTSRSESVGLATFVSAEQLAEHRKFAKATKEDHKGTWSRIKKVWSTMGRTQLQIPN